MCKAITIHKGQGITVGKGKEWPCVVIYFNEGKKRSQAGLELVAASRAESKHALFVGNNSMNLTKEKLRKIGKGEVYNKRHNYECYLKQLAPTTQKPIYDAITNMDVNTDVNKKHLKVGVSSCAIGIDPNVL